ncbi:lytic transglycosylase F [Parabacteroides sp. 52]|uniref:transglycosylase SLT domain-containing protein n=1 Tax=unclassified Parabacteroides TaxID=2649774 RepID=UPI0013D6C478|nr:MULTISPECIES: transglycosylase SLT domain-containing protein [unclassified Parabacteroides]MDH6533466.1 membrane-bound lytic murein transglycosylase F [Parabacteroides sp. PM5-20]NDV54222.1 lytic transglycosylase F [Parabacteroides sp. 52]
MYKPFVSLFFFLFFLTACYGNRKEKEGYVSRDLTQLRDSGEITAVTLYSSTSYFQYKMSEMGYEYDLIKDFANSQGLKLNIKVAENSNRLIEMLLAGEADVVAYPMHNTSLSKQDVLFCGIETLSSQVLIQRANRGDKIIKDVTQLIDKEVYVNASTRYAQRLNNLNEELGGGIHIKYIQKDTVTTEDLIEMVSLGEIPYTISDDNTARLNKTYYWNIHVSLPVSFVQRSSWIVRKNSPELAAAIDNWASDRKGKQSYKAVVKRYFELSKQPIESTIPPIENGHISPYDALFKKYAPLLGWDWQLLASIAYQESHFNPNAVSWAGAEGLMGIMPGTARALGVTPHELKNPEIGVRTGVECLRRFRQGFSEVEDATELIKLTLASYNAGIGHIYDAQRLAEKYGKDPTVWEDNVNEYVRLKRDPEYYNDPVCKHGYLRGTETFNYVHEVMKRYAYYKSKTSN